MRTTPRRTIVLNLFLFTFLSCTTIFGQGDDALKEGFQSPPNTAWPRTWWHWTGSNVTKEGITKDLEWMKRSGIAGFQLADVAFGGGQEVSDKKVFGSKEWLDAVRHTAIEAERLDLEMAIFSSAGWSLTGGPWVTPEQAMKKLVWSEIIVDESYSGQVKLPLPPSEEGPGPNLPGKKVTNGFYKDVAVIAFPTPDNEGTLFKPKITSNSGKESEQNLIDNDMNTGLTVKPLEEGGKAWIQLNFERPFHARAITVGAEGGIPFGNVSSSNDGVNFEILTPLPGKSGYRGGKIRTYTFPESKSKFYRIEFTNAPPSPADVISENTTPVDTAYKISEIKLHSGHRINRWEDKAGFNFLFEYGSVETPDIPPELVIDPSEIVDLTSKMSADGSLDWDLPQGKWTIMRFGYALTGAKNRPAVPSGLGYEVDKLNEEHVKAYMEEYTHPLEESLGDLFGKRLQFFLLDSWEAGIQNWTDDMLLEFERRRGYQLLQFLPALTGRVVGGSGISDRFLWDFRRTLVDMFAENHYGVVTDFLHKKGLKTYGEAGGVSLESIEDALLNKKYVDIPMGEFWVRDLHPSAMYFEDVRGAASASHIYGKKMTAAEAFTGGNYESPQTLKNISDYWFTQGINQLVFHTSAHQPLDTKPGNAMVGTHLHRNITWAEHVKPFTTYLARSSFMLQQGNQVADIAYLLDEGAPSTMPFWGGGLQPKKPKGYDFDYINADILLNYMSVNEKGELTLPSGMTYSVLVLPGDQQMTVPVLEKVRELAEAGATVVGPKPVSSPSLGRFPESDKKITQLAHEVWGDLDGKSRTRRRFGGGRIFWGLPLDEVLFAADVPRDVDINFSEDEFSWIHRREGEIDIYFVVNRKNRPLKGKANFRTVGKDVQFWYPDNGSVKPAGYEIQDDHTSVTIDLDANEAVFVVFRNKIHSSLRNTVDKEYTVLDEIEGKWNLTFPKGWGAPEKVRLPKLYSWTAQEESGIKYFSGTGTYTKTFEVKDEWLQTKQKIILDLGTVRDMAEVYINGNRTELLWKAPFKLEVTDFLRPGRNQLQVSVTNQWTNRLLGDSKMEDNKVLDSYTRPFLLKNYELMESGLIGPVKLLTTGKNIN